MMKTLKMFGLAAIAALGLMAFLGASSASADVLCTENINPCPKGKTVTTIVATLHESSTLHNTAGTETFDTCTESTVGGSIEHQGEGVNPSGNVTTLDWGTSAPCTHTTDTVKPGELEVDTVEGRSTVTSRGAEVTVTIGGVSCIYGTGTGVSLGDLTPGTPATLDVNAAVLKTGGSFACPSSARWTAHYTITNHTSVFVVTKAED